MEIKKIVVKKKKVLMFLVNSCHILVAAHFLLWYTQIPYLVLSWGALPINNNERWMARITSYWRSIKFNQFIARVRNKYYNKKRCALKQSQWYAQPQLHLEISNLSRGLFTQSNIYGAALFCENYHWVLTQGVKQKNNFGVRRDESSKSNPLKVS